jgi:hypothetical protein
MISRSEAERLIRHTLQDAGLDLKRSGRKAAELVDPIYGALGADSINPRCGTRHYSEVEAD